MNAGMTSLFLISSKLFETKLLCFLSFPVIHPEERTLIHQDSQQYYFLGLKHWKLDLVEEIS